MASFDDIDNYPRLLASLGPLIYQKVLIRIFCYFLWILVRYSPIICSVCGLNGITRYMLLCSMVYGITAEIPCSIAHLKAHSTDLGLQMHKTCVHILALGIGHTLVNITKGLNFSVL